MAIQVDELYFCVFTFSEKSLIFFSFSLMVLDCIRTFTLFYSSSLTCSQLSSASAPSFLPVYTLSNNFHFLYFSFYDFSHPLKWFLLLFILISSFLLSPLPLPPPINISTTRSLSVSTFLWPSEL